MAQGMFQAMEGALRTREYLELAVEKDEQGIDVYCCTIMEAPPEGGWRSSGDYHQHPVDWPSYQEPCPSRHLFDSIARIGISALTREDADRLTIGMLARRAMALSFEVPR